MSLVTYFLQKPITDHSSLKYFNSLLSYPIPRLIKEQDSNNQEIQALNKQMKQQAMSESKEFIEALGDGKDLLNIGKSISENLMDALEQTKGLSQIIDQNAMKIEFNLQEQKKLRLISTQQNTISEILDIPLLLKTLLNAHHYNESLVLINFVENLKNKHESPTFTGLWKSLVEIKNKILEDIIEQMTDTTDLDKTSTYLSVIKSIKNCDNLEICKLYLTSKRKFLDKKLQKQNSPKLHMNYYLSMLKDNLPKIVDIFQEKFAEFHSWLELFLFDIISDLFGDVSNVFLKLETISDIKESSVLLYEINEKIFCKIGADMTNEIRKMMISVAERKLIEMCSKTFMHFETMVKLFMWESLGGKENPLIEYGSIGVLYNNCVTIINEIRWFLLRELPLVELKPVFYSEISELLKKTAEYSLQKGSHLLPESQLTRQQKIYRSLFIGFLTCLKTHFYPEIIRLSLDTFDDSEEYERNLVRIIQNEVFTIINF